MKTKIYLKRIKQDSTKSAWNAPDYEGFFSSKKGDFYAVGWLNDLSDLSLTIEPITEERLSNQFFQKKYVNWKFPNLKHKD